MSERKHTGGKWVVGEFDGVREVKTDGPRRINNITAGTPVICAVHTHPDWQDYSADKAAALIAAAPDLLEALTEAEQKLRHAAFTTRNMEDSALFAKARDRAQAAIIKATNSKQGD